MSDRFWSFDPEDGFQRHATEAEARAAAQSALDWYAGESASEGWDDEAVERVCWGEVREAVVVTSERDLAAELAAAADESEREDIKSEFGPWDAIVAYALAPVSP